MLNKNCSGSSLQTAFQFVCLSLTSFQFHICYLDSTQVDMSVVWAGDLA